MPHFFSAGVSDPTPWSPPPLSTWAISGDCRTMFDVTLLVYLFGLCDFSRRQSLCFSWSVRLTRPDLPPMDFNGTGVSDLAPKQRRHNCVRNSVWKLVRMHRADKFRCLFMVKIKFGILPAGFAWSSWGLLIFYRAGKLLVLWFWVAAFYKLLGISFSGESVELLSLCMVKSASGFGFLRCTQLGLHSLLY